MSAKQSPGLEAVVKAIRRQTRRKFTAFTSSNKSDKLVA